MVGDAPVASWWIADDIVGSCHGGGNASSAGARSNGIARLVLQIVRKKLISGLPHTLIRVLDRLRTNTDLGRNLLKNLRYSIFSMLFGILNDHEETDACNSVWTFAFAHCIL